MPIRATSLTRHSPPTCDAAIVSWARSQRLGQQDDKNTLQDVKSQKHRSMRILDGETEEYRDTRPSIVAGAYTAVSHPSPSQTPVNSQEGKASGRILEIFHAWKLFSTRKS